MKAFEIFRPGKFHDSAGGEHNFTEEMLSGAASVYEPSLHEAPLCVGHPKDDAPAYGWVKALSFSDGRLVAEPEQVEPQFAEMVKEGRFKARSASWYPPTHKSNPKPGHWYLKHIAFLGAQAPAVKGLQPVSFSADEEGVLTVEFSESERRVAWALSSVGRLAQAIRDFFVAERGEEEADKAVPKYIIEELYSSSGQLREASKDTRSFSEPPNPEPKEDPLKLSQEQLEARAAELDEREKGIETREAEVGTKEASFSEAEKKARRASNDAKLEALIKEGKFAPALKAEALDFLDGLDSTATVEFGEGDGKTKSTPSDWFLGLLEKSGTIVDFSEKAKGGEVVDENTDPEDLANRAVAFQEEQRGKGIDITIEQAVRHVAKNPA